MQMPQPAELPPSSLAAEGRELLRALSGAVPRRMQERGEEYVAQGRVVTPFFDGVTTEAAVIGSGKVYDVALSRAGGRLEVACNCPAFADGWVCKHIWAVATVAARGAPRPDIVIEPEVPAWRRLLEGIQAQAAHRARARTDAPPQLMYFLDVPETVGADRVAFRAGARGRRGRRALRWLGIPDPRDVESAADPLDRAILGFLGSSQDPSRWWADRSRADARCRLAADQARELLPLLCRSGRFYWIDADRWGSRPLRWDAGTPYRFEAGLEEEDTKDDTLRLAGRFVRDGETVPLEEPLLTVDGGFLLFADRVALYDSEGSWPWVRELRVEGDVRVPRADLSELYATCLEAPGPLPLAVPAELLHRDVSPVPVARFEPASQGRIVLDLAFRYEERLVPETDTHPRCQVGDHWIARRPAEERTARDALAELGLQLNQSGTRSLREKEFLTAAGRLLDAGWEVQAEACPLRRGEGFSLSLATGQDWMDVRGEVSFEGQLAPLPAILEAARNGSRTVKLGDGSLGLLPEVWAQRWGLLEALGHRAEEGLRFQANQAWLLDALLSADEAVTTDASFGTLRERVGDLRSPRPLAAPRAFQGTLRPYQKEGLGWLSYLHRAGFGGCLADDMGLGKTIQVLGHLARLPRRERGPSLLVAPRSLVFNWMAESARFTPGLRLLDLSGTDRRKRMAEIPGHDLVFTTYGCLRRDIESLREHRFRYAILDEAQAIKNARTQAAKAARLVPADHRLALSGTPVENHLGELWSIFEFLNPGMLGRSRAFAALAGKNGSEIDAGQREALARAIRPFVLRRTKAQVLPDLPARSDSVIPCPLGGRQRRDYDAVRSHYRHQILSAESPDLGRMKIHILEALLRLRQIACHPGLVDRSRGRESSSKLEALWPMLEELQQEDHKVLIFSQFTSFLDIIEERLGRQGVVHERLDGRTRDRAGRVERFQNDPECRVFLISLKAGGLGLNLTAADYVILMDPWWNPAVESQAIDRAHRFGQRRKVFTYRFVAQETIEERILALQEDKRTLADQIFTSDNAFLRDITTEDLRFLLS